MKSLRSRLTAALIGAGALLVAALCATAFLRARALLTAQFDDGLRARAAALVSLLNWSADGSVDFDYKGEFMPEFERGGGGFYFAVWMEKDGRLIEQSHSLGGAALPKFGDAGGDAGTRELVLASGASIRAVGLRAPFKLEADAAGEKPETSSATGDAQPGALVVIAGDTGTLTARLRRLAAELALAGLLGLALVAVLVRASLRRGLSPLTEVSDLAARLDAEHLAERFPLSGIPAELAPICDRLNDLLARLESAFARERRFSADVAHELRTPIAELRTLADVGGGIPGASAETAAFFQDAHAIAGKMDATVAALLLIARCESGGQPIERSPVDIGTLVAALCAEFEPGARARDVALECHAPAGFILETDAALFNRLARILLENAVEYTRTSGLIAVCVSARELSITNGPTDLAPEDVPRLCERFWRKDAARTDSTHAGLGLPLATEIARLLGCRLTPCIGANSALTVRVYQPE